jgi:dTDP-glucose pyrophosphorylase
MNILILCAGKDNSVNDEAYPLCLTEFDSIPLIERVIEACSVLEPSNLIVALRQEDILIHHVDSVVTLLSPSAAVVGVNDMTQGAACTALLAIGHINNDEDLLIVNGNEFLDEDFKNIIKNFRDLYLDAGVVIFRSIHPRYSYVSLNGLDRVIEASEKKPISTNATVGFYWFSKGSDFVDAAKSMVRKDTRINGKFFICPSLNELILKDKKIGVFRVDGKQYHPLKTSRQLQQFEVVLDREKGQ